MAGEVDTGDEVHARRTVPGTDSGEIEFRVLGPVEARRGGLPVRLGGPRQRTLLALLILEPGVPVAVDRLVDELWHGDPPTGAATTLRSYVSRLRTALGTDAAIRGATDGYALDVDPDRIDAVRFERLSREGGEALARGAVRRAAERLREAESLWRGPPFGELGGEGLLRLAAGRLEEVRLRSLEERIEADLALGRSSELVGELETLVREYPFRECLWRLLMLALYRSERQADALAAYQRARTILDEELGLEPSQEMQQLERAILRHEVPAAVPPEERHNLPAPLTSFVGRQTELADVERLLSRSRLVTLTGVGGSGKTRLAIEAAARAVPDFSDGVLFVDLSPLTDAALVAHQVASAAGAREDSDRPVVDLLVGRMHDARALLVLDNCEHVREACADLVHRLLSMCSHLRLLATSREQLGSPGEVEYPVPPLALPPAEAEGDAIRSSEAVQLFLARARAVRPRLADDDAVVAAAARICRDLDGLPLAIELAAIRAKALSLDDIAARLRDRFRFLVSWRRLAPARHRTLRAAMDWSYDLLSGADRRLLAWLSVFAGGFTLDAVARVCVDDDEDALDLIERLVDASLVVAEERSGMARYRLLETVRQYAAERLAEAGQVAAARDRHAYHFLALAMEAWGPIRGPDQAGWIERLAIEHDNLRAALVWLREAETPEPELRLAEALWWFWWVRGHAGEGRAWLEDALSRGPVADPTLRARALEGAAGLAWAQGDIERAVERAELALELLTQLGDPLHEAACLIILGHAAAEQRDFRGAEQLFSRSRELTEPLADDPHARGTVAVSVGNLAGIAFEEGELERAAGLHREAIELSRRAEYPQGVAIGELYLGLVCVESGRHDEAAGPLAHAIGFFRSVGFLHYAAQTLEAIGALMHARGSVVVAARLLGAASALRERTGNPPAGRLARLLRREVDSIRDEIGEPAFAAAWSAGRALPQDDAFEEAVRAVGP